MGNPTILYTASRQDVFNARCNYCEKHVLLGLNWAVHVWDKTASNGQKWSEKRSYCSDPCEELGLEAWHERNEM
jgi:hypothetical protein